MGICQKTTKLGKEMPMPLIYIFGTQTKSNFEYHPNQTQGSDLLYLALNHQPQDHPSHERPLAQVHRNQVLNSNCPEPNQPSLALT